MFQKKTVFVIGAGASAEFGMPTGFALKNEVAKLLDRKSHNNNNEQFANFRGLLINAFGQDWTKLIEAGTHLSAAMPNFISIDEALHYFSTDERVVRVRTYTEQVDDGNIRAPITKLMDEAELIIFIGFGFHQQNVALLKRPVFATAHGVDRDNYDLFSRNLTQFFGANIRLFDKKGFDLMKDLRPTISAAASADSITL